MLITLSSLGIAGGAKAAIVTGPTDANITVSEGNSAIELSGVKDITFDFNNITKETRTFKETEPINADVINKTFGEKSIHYLSKRTSFPRGWMLNLLEVKNWSSVERHRQW